MRRWLPLTLALIVAVVACETWWPQIRNEFFVIIGNRDEAGGYYGWWSGNAGGLQIFEWAALGGMLYWHRSCNASPWCLRWGKYPAAGGVFHTCRHHHPELLGQKPRLELIHRLHREHLERTAR